jgi:hypothetical protein
MEADLLTQAVKEKTAIGANRRNLGRFARRSKGTTPVTQTTFPQTTVSQTTVPKNFENNVSPNDFS